MKRLMSLLLFVAGFAFAVDMPNPSEQFYVVQGIFNELNIQSKPCDIQDDVVNFACGQFDGDAATFQEQFDAYVSKNLPGLYLAIDWRPNGTGIYRDYRSARGQYLFAFNPGGNVVIAFIPRQ